MRLINSLVIALGFLAACTPIADRFDRMAADQGLVRRAVMGAGFRHAIFRKKVMAKGGVLHIYLEGDGAPLVRGRVPAKEPTPRRPVMPALMALDPAPAVLLGRPCYHGLAKSPRCRPRHWSGGRYGRDIVDSMAAAAARLIAAGGYDGAVLIGHSGGGVLALLMAPGIPKVRAVIALATVPDIDLWTRYRGLAPLTGSLNPNRQPPAGIPEFFAVGGQDRVTPAALVARALRRRPGARLIRYGDFDQFDHACCWSRVWPRLLALTRNLPDGPADRSKK